MTYRLNVGLFNMRSIIKKNCEEILNVNMYNWIERKSKTQVSNSGDSRIQFWGLILYFKFFLEAKEFFMNLARGVVVETFCREMTKYFCCQVIQDYHPKLRVWLETFNNS